jgi:hypothetical protein
MGVIRIAGEAPARFLRRTIAGEDGYAIPAFLALPYRTVPGRFEFLVRKGLVRRLQLLEAGHVRLLLIQPAQQDCQARFDTVDIVGCYFHKGVKVKRRTGLRRPTITRSS